jgi:hypothetical protein
MRYSNDPYWLTARFTSKCAKCGATITKGSQAFYFPRTKSIFCAGDNCGGQESRSFDSSAFDESVYNY